MCTIVSRLLAHHLTFFHDQQTVRHIGHQYSCKSALKSELVRICIKWDLQKVICCVATHHITMFQQLRCRLCTLYVVQTVSLLLIVSDVTWQANIGIIHANPSSTAGVIDVMSALSEFVPRLNNETVRVIATHGDCLAVELMVDAKREQSHDMTTITRLQGLEPVPQEFHHRRVMLQVGLPPCILPVLHFSAFYANVFQCAQIDRWSG